MKSNNEATPVAPAMGLLGRLGWEYYFGNENGCIHTGDGAWIVTKGDLEKAAVFPDDEAFVNWLESIARERLEADPVEFFSTFVTVDGLVSDQMAQAMMKAFEHPDEKLYCISQCDVLTLLRVSDAVKELQQICGSLVGRTLDNESIVGDMLELGTVLLHIFNIADENQGRFFTLLESDIKPEEKIRILE